MTTVVQFLLFLLISPACATSNSPNNAHQYEDLISLISANDSRLAEEMWRLYQWTFGNFSFEEDRHRQRRSVKYSISKSEDPELPLRCPPCEQLHCFRQQRKRRLHCPGGKTLDICECCRVCAKLEGELCGGQHNYLGKCDKELYCESQEPQIVHVSRGGVMKTYTITRGVCKKVPEKPLYTRSFLNGTSYVCRPPCEPRFCKKNPRAICSANQCAENHRKCQEPCQHTSCRACKYVQPETLCPRCSLDDFKCLRDFGRCIRRNTCQKKIYEYPCKTTQRNKEPKGQFMCQVPECTAK